MPGSFLDDIWRFVRARFARGERYGLAVTLALLAVWAGAWSFVEILDAATEQEALYHLDQQIKARFESMVTPETARYVVYLTNTGGFIGTLALVAVVALGMIWRRRWWTAFEIALTSGLGVGVVLGLKAIFARTRPEGGFVTETGFSYPSGHAFMAVVFYGYLAYLAWHSTDSRLWRTLAVLGALVMIALLGTSRLYLGVHWLTDVLGGYASGLVWLVASLLVLRWVEHRRVGERVRE